MTRKTQDIFISNNHHIAVLMVEKQVKTTVRIREDLFLKIKLLATVKGESFNNMVNHAIEDYIRQHENEIKKGVSELMRGNDGVTS